jgi:hypothetical protein
MVDPRNSYNVKKLEIPREIVSVKNTKLESNKLQIQKGYLNLVETMSILKLDYERLIQA